VQISSESQANTAAPSAAEREEGEGEPAAGGAKGEPSALAEQAVAAASQRASERSCLPWIGFEMECSPAGHRCLLPPPPLRASAVRTVPMCGEPKTDISRSKADISQSKTDISQAPASTPPAGRARRRRCVTSLPVLRVLACECRCTGRHIKSSSPWGGRTRFGLGSTTWARLLQLLLVCTTLTGPGFRARKLRRARLRASERTRRCCAGSSSSRRPARRPTEYHVLRKMTYFTPGLLL
jgi:hypothetical protein